jgi:hypothetical protein
MNVRTLIVLVAAAIGLASFGGLFAQDDGSAAANREIQALRGAVLKLASEIHELRTENHQLRDEFERHSHPVKIWNARRKKITEWKAGVYFIGFPAVGAGGSDNDARNAGGTWGTP